MAIWKFEYKYAFLSMHCPCTIEMDGVTYESALPAYLALVWPEDKEKFVNMSGVEANIYLRRRLSSSAKVGNHKPNYETDPVKALEKVLRIKFSHPSLKRQLLATRPQTITYVNEVDSFWGKVPTPSIATINKEPLRTYRALKGEDYLGKTLMKLRREYAKETA